VPVMLEQGGGHFLVTASAAGLLTILGNAPYAVTKHAAVALAEWLAITYGDSGLRVACLCPEFVRTDMLAAAGAELLKNPAVVEPEDVAAAVVEGLADERFLILPHPEVAEFFRRKAGDYDRWLAGMRRLQAASRII
jgi:NAD(P)-dependent dehydrogenase (short-subunit alcohol dehydrogenase family)